MKLYKVHVLNLDSVGTACGYGEGATLAQAQAEALALANRNYTRSGYTPTLSENGYTVYVKDGARMG